MVFLRWDGSGWRAVVEERFEIPRGTMICFPWENLLRTPVLRPLLQEKLEGVPMACRLGLNIHGRLDFEQAGAVFRSDHEWITPGFVRALGEAVVRLVVEALLGFPQQSMDERVPPVFKLDDFVKNV